MADNLTMNDDDADTTASISEAPIPRPIRFWLLLLFNIPALICTLFLLYHLFVNRHLRQAIHNHFIIVFLLNALICQIIDIPAYITYLGLGYVWISTPVFCMFWSFIDIGLFAMFAILMAFGAMERHILVFHSRWIARGRRRFLFHYLPLILIIIYDVVFYVYAIFFPPCENTFDYSQPWCSYPCFYDHQILAMYETIVNCLLPTILIVIFSIALLLRYIAHRRKIQRAFQWRKLRKMIIQLLSVSSLFLVFYLPLIIIFTVQLCVVSTEILINAQLYAYFFSYFIPLLSPYVCLASLPELWKKFKIQPIQWLRTKARRTDTIVVIGIENKC